MSSTKPPQTAVRHRTGGLAPELVARLGEIDGIELRCDVPLAGRTTLRVGGPAEVWAEVLTENAAAELLRLTHEASVELVVLGQGANVLVPDEGLRGVVAHLGGELLAIELGERSVSAGGAAPLAKVARLAARAGLAGLEALAGFPATVGGAVVMNAGCYGVEIRDVLKSARVLTRRGESLTLTADDLEPGYRSTNLQGAGALVTRAELRLEPGEAELVLARMEELNRRRWRSLPSGLPNAGSIFKNPPGDYAGRLIEAAGLKGAVEGGASISERHANVITNRGGATAADVLSLMQRARARVADRFGVVLEAELVLLGGLGEAWQASRPAVDCP